jgi:hypothetical protein
MLELRVSWPEILTNVKMALVILYLFTNSIRIFVEHDAIREVDVMVQPLNKCIPTICLSLFLYLLTKWKSSTSSHGICW